MLSQLVQLIYSLFFFILIKANFVKVSMCDPSRKNHNIHSNKKPFKSDGKNAINTIMQIYLSGDIVDVFLRYI